VVSAGQRVRVDIHLVWGGNLGTPGDDVTIGIRSKGSPKGPAPRTRESKPDLSCVWVGNAAEFEAASLLPWAEAIFNERRANAGAGNPGTSCLPGDIFLVSPFIYKIIQTPAVIAILWEGNPPGVVQILLNGRGHSKESFPTWMGDSIGRWEGDTPAPGSRASGEGSDRRRQRHIHPAVENSRHMGSRADRRSARVRLQRKREGRGSRSAEITRREAAPFEEAPHGVRFGVEFTSVRDQVAGECRVPIVS